MFYSPQELRVKQIPTCSSWRIPPQSWWKRLLEQAPGSTCGPAEREEPKLEHAPGRTSNSLSVLEIYAEAVCAWKTGPVKRTHSAVVCEELQPIRRTHFGEICAGLFPVVGTPCWRVRTSPPRQEGVAQTMCNDLTTISIPCSSVFLGERK